MPSIRSRRRARRGRILRRSLPFAMAGLMLSPTLLAQDSGGNLKSLNVWQYNHPSDWEAFGPLTGIVTRNGGGGAFLGYSKNDAAPGTFVMPSGVAGWGQVARGSQGNAAFGVYGLGTLNATSGGVTGAEFTVRNNSGQAADPNLPPSNGIPTQTSFLSSINATCGTDVGTTYGCSLGIYIGHEGATPFNEFRTGLWIPYTLGHDIVLGGARGVAPTMSGDIEFCGAASGCTDLTVNPTTSGKLLLPPVAGTDTLATLGATQNFTGRTGMGIAAPATTLDVAGSSTYRSLPNVGATFRAATSDGNDAAVALGVVNGNGPYLAATATGAGTNTSLSFLTAGKNALVLDTAQNATVTGTVTAAAVRTGTAYGGNRAAIPACTAEAVGTFASVADGKAEPKAGSRYAAADGAAKQPVWCNGANWLYLM